MEVLKLPPRELEKRVMPFLQLARASTPSP
jgi:hypothetical protein